MNGKGAKNNHLALRLNARGTNVLHDKLHYCKPMSDDLFFL